MTHNHQGQAQRHRRGWLRDAVVCAVWVMLSLASSCTSPSGMVLWHAYSGTERTALEAAVARYNARHPEAPLMAVALPHDGMADKLASAIPHDNGPDLFIYPHDRIGDWTEAGVIEPIGFWVTDDIAARFLPEALALAGHQRALWGLPLALKTQALYYRTDHCNVAPTILGQACAQAPVGAYPLGYVNADLYGHAPLLHAFGARVFTDDGALAIDSAAATQAAAFARKLVSDHILAGTLDGPTIASMFNDGKLSAVISGPWFTGDIDRSVPWAVIPLPALILPDGNRATPAPYLGADILFLSARARHKAAAYQAMRELTDDNEAIARAQLAHQIVANTNAYRDASVAAAADLTAFRNQVSASVEMPKTARMRVVWTPYRTALGDILSGRAEPGPALRRAAAEIEEYARAQR